MYGLSNIMWYRTYPAFGVSKPSSAENRHLVRRGDSVFFGMSAKEKSGNGFENDALAQAILREGFAIQDRFMP
jgi:hypothetical protein